MKVKLIGEVGKYPGIQTLYSELYPFCVCLLVQGNFSKVYQGFWEDKNGTNVEVAIKVLKDKKAWQDMKAEAERMHQLKHDNIVSILGYSKMENECMVITEYVAGGDLKSFMRRCLKEGRPLDNVTQMRYASQVAFGMAHLVRLWVGTTTSLTSLSLPSLVDLSNLMVPFLFLYRPRTTWSIETWLHGMFLLAVTMLSKSPILVSLESLLKENCITECEPMDLRLPYPSTGEPAAMCCEVWVMTVTS